MGEPTERSLAVLEDGSRRTPPLAPRPYVLQVSGSGVAATRHAFEVNPDTDTWLDIRPEPGKRYRLRILDRGGREPARAVRLIVRERGGGALAEGGVAFVTEIGLPGGVFEVLARSDEGGEARGRIFVDEAPGGAAGDEISLELR